MEKTPFYITTTLPYVNSRPHIGFALEVVRADAVARYKRLMGHPVFFNTGTDEHGAKIFQKAEEQGVTPQELVNAQAKDFQALNDTLNLSFDAFTRTSSATHKASAQAFWRAVAERGYIEKRAYKAKYCVGCELEKTDSELVDGRCILHPNREIEYIDEENYFFKFSAFADDLLRFYNDRPDFLIPDFRFNEVKEFVASGLEDFSISRLKEKMPWGVAVPDDDAHVMYVWFDALVNYISAIGWPHDMEMFGKWWNQGGGVVQYAGKDNVRQQAAMWQAMLFAAGITPSKHIVINGFITSAGVKMSKSLGNVIDPQELVEEYGTDALRLFLLKEISSFEDSDFTKERFAEAYTAYLVNGIGNVVSRIMKMAESAGIDSNACIAKINSDEVLASLEVTMQGFQLNEAMQSIFEFVAKMDSEITETEPYKVIKTDREAGVALITKKVRELGVLAHMLAPFLPETSEKIIAVIKTGKKPAPLFARK